MFPTGWRLVRSIVRLHRNTLSPLSGGIAFGLGLWAISYLGWIPEAGILRPATQHLPRRTALMVAAHVVWGSVFRLLVDRFQKQPKKYFAQSVKKDDRE